MGKLINNAVKIATLGTLDDVTGVEAGEKAARRATAAQTQAGQEALALQREQFDRAFAAQQAGRERAQGFLSPFQSLGQQGLSQAALLTDPQAQADFLRNNPILNLAIENANRQVQQSAAAQGRLSAGDTQTALANNTLLQGLPFLQNQQQNIVGLLNQGVGLAGNQANIETGSAANQANLDVDFGARQGQGIFNLGNVRAAGVQAQAAPDAAFRNSLLNFGLNAGASLIASDARFKDTLTFRFEKDGVRFYEWEWNNLAEEKAGQKVGTKGSGVIAQEVRATHPEAVSEQDGFLFVDYSKLPGGTEVE